MCVCVCGRHVAMFPNELVVDVRGSGNYKKYANWWVIWQPSSAKHLATKINKASADTSEWGQGGINQVKLKCEMWILT